MAEPRAFRPKSDVLALRPEAIEFSYLYTGPIPNRTENGIAIVTIHGPLEHHSTYWWDSYEDIVERVECAMRGDVSAPDVDPSDQDAVGGSPANAVVLCIDSPGGEAAGAGWAHKRIKALSKQYGVPVYAYANETCCSAAYEIACAAREIWLPETGLVGSIGVIGTLFDRTAQNDKSGLLIELVTSGEQKADGHADRPLTDDIRARMQKRVDELAVIFWRIVSKARGTTPAAIQGLQAGTFLGYDAIDQGIADGVASWKTFLKLVASAPDSTDDMTVATAPAT